MQLKALIEKLPLEVISCCESLEGEVKRGYTSDLMSDVLAHAAPGDIWITLQVHMNVIAVASTKDIAGVIMIGVVDPDPDTIERAEMENIPVMRSRLPAFELSGRIYQLGIPGI